MDALSAAQYLSYLSIGIFYFSVLGAVAGAERGTSLVRLGAVLIPLILGGYVSGLSLIKPRVAAVVATTLAIPYLLFGVLRIRVSLANWVLVLTSSIIIGVSLLTFLWSQDSVWRRTRHRFTRFGIGMLVTLPALLATGWFVSFMLGLLSSLRTR